MGARPAPARTRCAAEEYMRGVVPNTPLAGAAADAAEADAKSRGHSAIIQQRGPRRAAAVALAAPVEYWASRDSIFRDTLDQLFLPRAGPKSTRQVSQRTRPGWPRCRKLQVSLRCQAPRSLWGLPFRRTARRASTFQSSPSARPGCSSACESSSSPGFARLGWRTRARLCQQPFRR